MPFQLCRMQDDCELSTNERIRHHGPVEQTPLFQPSFPPLFLPTPFLFANIVIAIETLIRLSMEYSLWNTMSVFFGGLLTSHRPGSSRAPSRLCNVCRRAVNLALPQRERICFPIQTMESFLESCRDGCMLCIMIHTACKRNPHFAKALKEPDFRRAITQGASRREYKLSFWWVNRRTDIAFWPLFLSRISCRPANSFSIAHADAYSAKKFQCRNDSIRKNILR
jgi:hypothetical protein